MKTWLILIILIIGIMGSGCTTNENNTNIKEGTENIYKIVKIFAERQNGYNENIYTITYFDENNISREEKIWATGNSGYNTTIIISNESKLTIKHTTDQHTEYIIYSDKNGLID